MHEVDLLFECILIRDGQAALPCWSPRSDVQTIVNSKLHMHGVRCFLYVFLSFFVLFYIIFRVPWYDLHNK